MSIESAKLFIKRMCEDSEFEKKVNSIETVEELKAFIIENGYDFNEKEFNEVYGSKQSKDEPDNVTGEKIRNFRKFEKIRNFRGLEGAEGLKRALEILDISQGRV